jgi:hypothetical protein
MHHLQDELGGGADRGNPPDRLEVRRQLDQLMEVIARPGSESEKQHSIRQYLDLARQLEDNDERVSVLRELNEVAAPKRTQVDPIAVDAIWKRIEGEPDEPMRQALIRDYLKSLQQLPEPERLMRTAALQRFRNSSVTSPDGTR